MVPGELGDFMCLFFETEDCYLALRSVWIGLFHACRLFVSCLLGQALFQTSNAEDVVLNFLIRLF